MLRSTTHPLTPHAWATIVTGVNAGRHGIWDFTERDETGYQLRARQRELPPGAGGLGPAAPLGPAHGHRQRALHLAGARGGRLRHCRLRRGRAAKQGLTYPAELRDELRQRFGSLELDNKFPLTDGKLDLDLVRRAAAQKVEIVTWLAERFDPELLFVVFMAADHIHHLCWTEWEADGLASPVADVYRILDEATGALAALAGEEGNVLVVSDHGAGPLHGVVNLNAWLASEGFLAYATGGGVAGRKLLGDALRLRRYLPEGLRNAAKQRLPGLRERAIERGDYTVLDWERTQAFSYGTFGNIVLNVRGREEHGIVEPGEEYERVRDEIAARLLELRGPGGERIVAQVAPA